MPNPMTATCGFCDADSGMGRSLGFVAAEILERLCLWVPRLGRATITEIVKRSHTVSLGPHTNGA